MQTDTQKCIIQKDLGWAFFYGKRLAKALALCRALHCKNELAVFPSPAGMSLIKLFLGGNNLVFSRPERAWSVTSLLGTGKWLTLFYSVYSVFCILYSVILGRFEIISCTLWIFLYKQQSGIITVKNLAAAHVFKKKLKYKRYLQKLKRLSKQLRRNKNIFSRNFEKN
jgi:hypothetical protein